MSHQLQQAQQSPPAKVITDQQRSRARIGLLLRWTVCHLLLALVLLVPLAILPLSSILPGTLGIAFCMGELAVIITLGAWLGLAQVLALTKPKAQLPEALTKIWWGHTFLGGLVGISTAVGFGIILSLPLYNLLHNTLQDRRVDSISLALAPAFAGGMALGAVQWRALRHHTKHAIWWIPANSVGWGLGIIIAILSTEYADTSIKSALESIGIEYSGGITDSSFLYSGVVSMLRTSIAIAVVGIVTAGPIAWLLQPSSNSASGVYRWKHVAQERDDSGGA